MVKPLTTSTRRGGPADGPEDPSLVRVADDDVIKLPHPLEITPVL
jgi:hypothetical protein